MGKRGYQKKYFEPLTLAISLIALSTAIAVWSDLFLFSKVVHLAEWMKALPSPINTPKYIAFICLIPIALKAKKMETAISGAAITILLSPFPALVLYATDTKHQNEWLLANLTYHYFWVIGFHCLLPAIILIGIRKCWEICFK